jgi:hypothetical protein
VNVMFGHLLHLAETGPVNATPAAALASLRTVVACSSQDWGRSSGDAWLYGLVVGWDCEEDHVHNDDDDCGSAVPELAAEFGWDDEDVARLRAYRSVLLALTDQGGQQ